MSDVMRKIKNLALRAKRTSNITTLIFISYMAYTINQWQIAMGIDNFINLTILAAIMAVNIKFYKIYLNAADLKSEEAAAKAVYRAETVEFNKLLRASLWMAVILTAAKHM